MRILFSLLVFLICGVTHAEPAFILKSQVNKATATTGDLIRFEIRLTSVEKLNEFPSQVGDQIMGFRIVNEGTEGPMKKSGRYETLRYYELRADLIGSYVLPAISMKVGEQTLTAPKIFVEVQTVLEPEGDRKLRDIKPIIEYHMPWWKILLIALGACLLLALLTWGFRKLQAWSQRKNVVPSVPCDEWARNEIDRLIREMGESWSIQDVEKRKRYYFRLSEILREYLERRFGFPAVDRTTEELLPLVKKQRKISTDAQEDLQTFLKCTDFVKFTDLLPQENDPGNCRDLAHRFIVKTKPEVALPTEAS